jgi:cell division protease FtsH
VSNPRTRSIVLFITIALVALFGMAMIRSSTTAVTEINFSDLVQRIEADTVRQIEVVGDQLFITFRDNTRAKTVKSSETDTYQQLASLGIASETLTEIEWINRRPSNVGAITLTIITTLLPILVIGGLILFFFRQSQGANNQAMSFGKSRARMFNADQPTVTFDDVAGCDEAKQELAEIVEFLREPEKFVQLGARIPKGVLMVGPPGTGKTLLSKAVAGEAGAPFFSISGSEFVEMFVGVGASRVRDLFDQAKRHSPSIIFIDEIDAVGRQRGAGLGGSHDEREQTLNQILVEMDGFDTDTNIIIIAATNRPDILDPALMRPGRFDRRVVIDRPDLRGREAILGVHVRGKPLAQDVDLELLARATPGFVGADLENMVNEGAILAARKNKKSIGIHDLEEAIERVMLGPERKSRVISDHERRVTAYHEAGHALIGHLLPHTDPVHKITIIPRGMAGGVTVSLPEADTTMETRSRLKEQLVMLLGGRVAEEIVFGEITTGASSDIQRVTRIARAMVSQFGMSDRLGPMIFGQKEEMVFLGREISEQRDYSEAVAQEIDTEVREMIHNAHVQAREILTENRSKLDQIAEHLLNLETLDRKAFIALMEGRPLTDSSSPPIDTSDKSNPQSKTDTDSRGSGSPKLGTAPSPA